MSDPAAPDRRPPSPLLKLAIELGPLVVFFVVQRARDIYWATGAFMVAITVSLVAARRIERRWPAMPLITAVFVVVMGGLTIWLQDATFIKLKPTIVNALFATILLGGLLANRLYLKIVFDGAFRLRDEGWRVLTVRFGLYFVFLAILNEIVWRTQSEDTWVTFKVFGIAPLTIVFLLAQGGLLTRYEVAPAGGGAGPDDSRDQGADG